MKMKRLFTLVLSLMMILSLSAPASAIDGENVYTKEEISSRNVIALDNSTELVSEKEFAVYKSAEKAMKQAAVQTRSGADDGLNYSDLDGMTI